MQLESESGYKQIEIMIKEGEYDTLHYRERLNNDTKIEKKLF
jgi:hypothetical protein